MNGFVAIKELGEADLTNKVRQIFSERNGQTSLNTFLVELVTRYGFQPANFIDKDDKPLLEAYRKNRYTIYEVKNGIVYENF